MLVFVVTKKQPSGLTISAGDDLRTGMDMAGARNPNPVVVYQCG